MLDLIKPLWSAFPIKNTRSKWPSPSDKFCPKIHLSLDKFIYWTRNGFMALSNVIPEFLFVEVMLDLIVSNA